MIKFGIRNKFEIWVNYYFIAYKDDPLFIQYPHKYEMGADVYFWVNGKNIFAFKDCGPDATYSFDLNILIDFFCSHLHYQIMDDPFPVKTIANNASDMMNETILIEGDDDSLDKWAEFDWTDIDMKICNQIDMWNYHHGLLNNSGGSFVPNAFFRRVGKVIEVSWNNKYPHKGVGGEIYLFYEKGTEYIDIKLYRDTIVNFCQDFMNKFKHKNPASMKENAENLQKAIDVVL